MRRRNAFLMGLFLFCLLFPLVFSSGCWDRREPNLLGVVTAVAFDFDPQTGLLQLIAQVANPLGACASSGTEGGGGGGGEKPFWVVETSGHTVYEAIKKTEQISTKKLIWSHIEVVLFSEALAQKGLRPVLDYIDRERQARLIARPFVVQGDVRELLKAEFPLEQLGGPALIRQLLTIRMENALVPEIDSLRRLLHHLSMPGVEPIIPRIEVQSGGKEKEEGKNDLGSSEGVGGQTAVPDPAKISGAALFRGDKLAGFFSETETAGYLWLTNNIRRLTIVFPCPGEADKYLTVELGRAVRKIEPQVQGDKVRLHFLIRAEGRLQDFAGLGLPLGENYKGSLNRHMEAVIRNQIKAAWQKAHLLNLDVFGFGYLLYQTRPGDWKRLEEKWAEIFPEIELEVKVQAAIKNYGLITKPLKIR